jgi:hypothetical protein
MNNIMNSFTQYRHYFFIILALMVANYAILPLSELQEEQQQTLSLLSKQSNKVRNLLANEADYDNLLEQVDNNLQQMRSFIFIQPDVSAFKLIAQAQLERVLNNAECDIQRIDFKGDTKVSDKLSRWRVELRFKGDATCLTQTTRGLEASIPSIHIADFNVNHRGLDKKVAGEFNAVINVTLWHLIEEEA